LHRIRSGRVNAHRLELNIGAGSNDPGSRVAARTARLLATSKRRSSASGDKKSTFHGDVTSAAPQASPVTKGTGSNVNVRRSRLHGALLALVFVAGAPPAVEAAAPTAEPIPLLAPYLKTPSGKKPPAGDLKAFKPRYPTRAQHTEFVVEVNGKGQVSRVRSGKRAPDTNFSAITYGNVMQTFIRTPDGNAIAGTYKMSYDYEPKTQRVKRNVALLHAGGVNASAPGIVDVLAERNRKGAAKARPAATASAVPSQH